jgi:hypothetical protein
VRPDEPLIGRDPELRRLTAALEGVLAGSGRLVRVVGEPGIGKTRLATETAQIATARGASVAWGRCWESGGAPAFWPWTQIVRALGADQGAAFEPQAASSAADAEQERFRFFDAMSQLLQQKSREQPLVLIVDDAHAADVPSLLLLRFVAATLPASRILLVVAHRDVEARIRPEVGDLLGKIARAGDTVFPRRLDEADLAAWLKEVGRAESQAAALRRVTEGNPLFVREVLELPPERGWDVAGSDAVRAAIDEHLGRIPPAARRVLEVAAVLGREASRADLALLATETPAEIDAAMRDAVALGIVETRGREGFAFRHILLRDQLYESVEAARRDELHERAADMYARRGDLGDEDALAPAAHHELQGEARAKDVSRAVERARRAAERSVQRAAYEEAAALLERAVTLVESRDALDRAASCELLLDWGEALVLSGLGPRGRDICARACALAKALGERALVVRAALVYGSELLTGMRDERMVALLRDALEAVGPEESPQRARVMARLAAALIPAPLDEAEPTRLAREALDMVRRSGDALATLQVLRSYMGALAFQASARERHSLVREILALATSLDKPAVLAATLPWAVAGDLELSGLHAFDARIAELAELVDRLPQPHYRVRAPIARTLRASLLGAWEEADVGFAQAKAFAENAESPHPRFLLAVALVGHHHARLDAAAFRRDHDLMTSFFEGWQVWSGGVFKALIAAVGAAAGALPMDASREAVRRELRERMQRLEVQAVLPACGTAGWAAVLVKDRELTASLEPGVAAQRSIGNRLIVLAGCAASLGPTALLLAEMAALLDRPSDARALYDEAIDFAEFVGARVYADRARAGKNALGSPSARPPRETRSAPAAPPSIALTQEGEMWTLRAGAEAWHLKPSKGLAYLAMLLEQPYQEFHVTQIVRAGEVLTGDAGPQLDEAAKESYRRRATDLREALDEATAHGDLGRAERARAELEALGDELARAVGIGGRDRKAASDVERMRVNVQRRLRDAIERVRAQSPALGRYLDASVRTGSFCSYAPAWTGKDR